MLARGDADIGDVVNDVISEFAHGSDERFRFLVQKFEFFGEAKLTDPGHPWRGETDRFEAPDARDRAPRAGLALMPFGNSGSLHHCT